MKIASILTGFALLTSLSAVAAVMIQPTSVTANAALVNANYDINRVIDQAQSTVAYTSGVTDHATYLAANPLAAVSGTVITSYSAFFLTPALVLDFDLGVIWDVTDIVLWNAPQSAAHIDSFSVSISLNSDFSVSTSLGTFSSTPSSTYPMVAESFAANSPALGRYVRITSTSSHAERTLLGEVAFAGTAVPEPSSALLAGVAVSAFLLRRRK